jgi:sortase A
MAERIRRVDKTRLAGAVLLTLSALLAGFVVYVVFLSAFPQSRAQTGLERRFRTLLANTQAPLGGHIAAGTPVARLDIPSIGVHQVVVEGTTADQTRKGPGHLPTSPLPGQIGNVVMAGHALAYGGPFGDIGSLHRGAVIVVLTQQGRSVYQVSRHETFPSSDPAPLRATADNRLTLITSDDLLGSRREVVVAKLSGRPHPAPGGRPSVLAPAESGLAGGGGVGPALVLFLELLLVVSAATFMIYRRLSRPASYLITTPILLVAIWLLYSTMGRLLPATL